MYADRAACDEWDLLEEPDGWTLRVKFRVRMREMAPYPVRTWIAVALFALLPAGAAVFARTNASSDRVPITDAIPVAVGLFLWTAGWWLWQTSFVQRFRLANRAMHASVRGDKLNTDDGIFDVSLLGSLRLDTDRALGGREALVFTSNSMSAAELVGWPGVPPDVAADILAAVQGRLATGAPTSAST